MAAGNVATIAPKTLGREPQRAFAARTLAQASTYASHQECRIENEKALIGAILWYGAIAHQQATAYVDEEHFTDSRCGWMFTRYGELIAQGVSGYAVTQRLMHEMQRDRELLDTYKTSSVFVGELYRLADPLIGVEGEARQIKYDWLADRLRQAVEEDDAERIEAIAAEQQRLVQTPHDRAKERVSALDAIDAVLGRANEFVRDGVVAEDFAFAGSSALARALAGWRRKRFYVLGGRPGMGKTTVGLSWLLRTAGKGHHVLFISLEMGHDELMERAIADLAWSPHARIEYSTLSRNTINAAGLERLYEARRRVKSLPLTIDDRSGLTLSQVRAACLQEKARLEGSGKRLDVVCIDHMGLLRASERYAGNKVAETEEISAGLKVLAKELDVAVIALMQLNRGVEGRDDKRPSLADLRWSGSIEQDADVVLFVYREEYYLARRTDEDPERDAQLAAAKDRLEVIIAKNRGGECKTLDFFCDLGCAAVRDLEQRS